MNSRRQNFVIRLYSRAGLLATVLCLGLVFPLGFDSIARAQTIDEAFQAYADGDFLSAADIGEKLNSSEGFALASKSLNIHLQYIVGEKGNEAMIERSMKLAQKAIETDPGNAEAYLRLTQAIGLHVKTLSRLEKASGGYAKKTREPLEMALEIDPEFVPALFSLGRWHAGIITRVGSLVGRVTFKARKKEAIKAFEKALELAPHMKLVHLEYAIGLHELSKTKNRKRVRELCEHAIKLPSKDAFDELIHTKAIEFLATIDSSEN